MLRLCVVSLVVMSLVVVLLFGTANAATPRFTYEFHPETGLLVEVTAFNVLGVVLGSKPRARHPYPIHPGHPNHLPYQPGEVMIAPVVNFPFNADDTPHMDAPPEFNFVLNNHSSIVLLNDPICVRDREFHPALDHSHAPRKTRWNYVRAIQLGIEFAQAHRNAAGAHEIVSENYRLKQALTQTPETLEYHINEHQVAHTRHWDVSIQIPGPHYPDLEMAMESTRLAWSVLMALNRDDMAQAYHLSNEAIAASIQATQQ